MAATAVTTSMAGAINYTYVTDTSADWASVPNNTYFYDKADKLVHYKNSGGTVLEIFGVSGLTYFTEAQSTAAPNATVNVDSLTAVAATANADIALVPKGTGALTLAIPDGTATGGDKRGTNAVDLQIARTNTNQVASGANSAILGSGNRAYGTNSVAVGTSSVAGGVNAIALGSGASATGSNSVAMAQGSATGTNSIAFGTRAKATYFDSLAMGGYTYVDTTASGQYSTAIGGGNTASGDFSMAWGGYGNLASGYQSYSSGVNTIASGSQSYSSGVNTNTFSITGRQTRGYYNTANGDCQKSEFFLSVRTTGNTATTLTVGGGAASTTNQVILSNNAAYAFEGKIIGKQSGSTNAAVWKVEGLIVRGANAASTVLTASTVTLFSNLPGWGTPTLAADTTNGGLQIQVAGLAATNIQWTAVIETTEVIYA